MNAKQTRILARHLNGNCIRKENPLECWCDEDIALASRNSEGYVTGENPIYGPARRTPSLLADLAAGAAVSLSDYEG